MPEAGISGFYSDWCGVAHRSCYGGGGDHRWPYWRNDLVDWLGYVYGATGTTGVACTND